MNILIDIGHPAHVHLFKYFIRAMEDKGHRLLATARNKEVAYRLLDHYGIPYRALGNPYGSVAGKIFGMVRFDLKLLNVSREFKPDLFLSHSSFYAAQVSALLGKPHISFEDTGNMEQIRLYKPFTEAILTPSCFKRDLGRKQIFYDGYHELAYLHPNRFKKDPSVLSATGLSEDDIFVIIRTVSWKASHDIGKRGLSITNLKHLTEEISKLARVFITSEFPLPEELQSHRLKIHPEQIHDFMAYASLYIGEGATMASECAMLGTPAIFIHPQKADTIAEQENYGLLHYFDSSSGITEKATEILTMPDRKEHYDKKREQMLAEKIDVTEFLVDLVENRSWKRKKERT